MRRSVVIVDDHAGFRAGAPALRGRLRRPHPPQRRAGVHLQGRAFRGSAGGRAQGERAMTRRRWALVLLGVAVTGWIIGGEWVSIHRDIPGNHFLEGLPVLSFLGAGIAAPDRRPGNVIGPVMIAFGVISYFGNWGTLPVPLLPTLGLVSGWLVRPLLAHIALAYPGGHLRTAFERAVLGAFYATSLGTSVLFA